MFHRIFSSVMYFLSQISKKCGSSILRHHFALNLNEQVISVVLWGIPTVFFSTPSISENLQILGLHPECYLHFSHLMLWFLCSPLSNVSHNFFDAAAKLSSWNQTRIVLRVLSLLPKAKISLGWLWCIVKFTQDWRIIWENYSAEMGNLVLGIQHHYY